MSEQEFGCASPQQADKRRELYWRGVATEHGLRVVALQAAVDAVIDHAQGRLATAEELISLHESDRLRASADFKDMEAQLVHLQGKLNDAEHKLNLLLAATERGKTEKRFESQVKATVVKPKNRRRK